MGCVCVKQAHIHNYADSPDANGSNRTSTWSLVFAPKKKPHTNHAQTPRSEYRYSQRIEGKRKENIAAASSVNEQKILERGLNFIPGNLSRHIEAEQVAAGWPDWLAAVAGEAINGWIPRRADSFERLYKVEQLHKIFKLCGSPSEEYWKKSKLPYATIFKPQQPYKRRIAETFKEVPSSTLALLETLLAIEPSDRGAAAGALKSEFFTTKPFPCNPSSLPTYPPSKELDAKVHEEEARRQIAAQGRGHRFEGIRRKSKQSRIGPTLDDSIESTTSIQKSHLNSQRDSKHRTKKFNTQQEGDTVGFPIYPLRPMQSSFEITAIPQAYALLPGSSYSGPILCTKMSNSAFGKKQKDDDAQMHASLPSDFKTLEIYGQPPVADLSDFSRLMAGRNYVRADTHRDQSALQWNYADGLEDVENGKHEISGVPDISIKQKRTQSQRPKSFKHPHSFQSWNNHGVDCRRDENFAGKEPVMGYVGQERRIHCSGPLLPPSANFDEILERHEQHLRRVVHRAQEGKDKAQRDKLYHTRKKAFERKGQGSTAKGNAESYDLKSGELNIVYGW